MTRRISRDEARARVDDTQATYRTMRISQISGRRFITLLMPIYVSYADACLSRRYASIRWHVAVVSFTCSHATNGPTDHCGYSGYSGYSGYIWHGGNAIIIVVAVVAELSPPITTSHWSLLANGHY